MFRIKLRNYMLKPVLIFGNTWTFALQNLPSIYQLSSNSVKKLFRIQIKKGILLWNQVKLRMEACYSELILVQNEVGYILAKNPTIMKLAKSNNINRFLYISAWQRWFFMVSRPRWPMFSNRSRLRKLCICCHLLSRWNILPRQFDPASKRRAYLWNWGVKTWTRIQRR